MQERTVAGPELRKGGPCLRRKISLGVVDLRWGGVQDFICLVVDGGLDTGRVDGLEAFFVVCLIRNYSIECEGRTASAKAVVRVGFITLLGMVVMSLWLGWFGLEELSRACLASIEQWSFTGIVRVSAWR